MMDININKIREVLKIMEEHELSEIEIESEGFKVRLKKRPSSGKEDTGINSSLLGFQEKKSPAGGKGLTVSKNLLEIKAPMVGTFYRASSPGAKPYVEVGDITKPGDVVCIIEAMKLMNEIKSEVKGKISEVFIENGQPVEFGQPLFLVEPL